MKELAIYLLLKASGTDAPSAAQVTAAAEKVGITVDSEALDQVIAALADKDLDAAIAAGKKKLVNIGGGSGAAAPAAAAAAGAAKEEKKEEKKEEEEEEAGGAGGLFGDDDDW